jgi:hypothetical protein
VVIQLALVLGNTGSRSSRESSDTELELLTLAMRIRASTLEGVGAFDVLEFIDKRKASGHASYSDHGDG